MQAEQCIQLFYSVYSLSSYKFMKMYTKKDIKRANKTFMLK